MKAFVSCSLREEDARFVQHIESILREHKVEPFGTVGRHAAAPENPVETMKKHIAEADIVVVCVTPRYLQKDLKSGKVGQGLPEMIHIETGMALANGKPVLGFVLEGTEPGPVFQSITQYIVLNGSDSDYANKKILISSLIEEARKATNARVAKEVAATVAIGGLATYGGIKLLQRFFGKRKR